MKARLSKDQWIEIGECTGWIQEIGFGATKFKFWQGPGTYCVCPHCGHMKRSVLLMPCERLTCPRCGTGKMERRYVEKGRQMSPSMFGEVR